MSLKRYAIIAALSYHNNRQHQQNGSTTTTTNGISTSSILTSPPSLSSPSSLSLPTSSATPQLSITTARTSLFSSSTTYGTSGGGGGGNIVFTSSNGSSVPAYYGGLSLFHQQNIRSGSGSGGGNGGTINGNVNLLLGGAMLSLVTTILCVVCYCCHRNIKKRTEAAYRQQRQWLESDPNMEIYSVEQCYETSGLFMGESTDGLSTLPTLHHEPPPSYDAVVAMHEQQLLQQQQQTLLQQHQQFRMSPPPGYRSSLDLSAITMATTTTTAGGAVCLPATLHLPSHNGSNGSFNNNNNNNTTSSNSVDNLNENLNNPCIVTRYNFAKQIGNRNLAHPLLNMKKLWNAQSCCSLQRAEVENMWNAAAAAVATRATHGGNAAATSNTVASAATPEIMLQSTTNLIARKSLPSYMLAATTTAAKLSVNELGRRYLNHQNQYRRGCPLCGKFRHDVDESLSLSTESGLDNLQSIVLNNNTLGGGGAYVSQEVHRRPQLSTTTDEATIVDENNDNEDYNNNNNSGRILAERRPSITRELLSTTDIDEMEAETEECSCGTSTVATTDKVSTRNEQDFENGNISMLQDMENNGEFSAAQQSSPEIVIGDTSSVVTTDNNANLAEAEENAISTIAATAISNDSNDNIEVVDFDSINENGIVRLDMSKIIDRTGLPTYEAALKLESSGYV